MGYISILAILVLFSTFRHPMNANSGGKAIVYLDLRHWTADLEPLCLVKTCCVSLVLVGFSPVATLDPVSCSSWCDVRRPKMDSDTGRWKLAARPSKLLSALQSGCVFLLHIQDKPRRRRRWEMATLINQLARRPKICIQSSRGHLRQLAGSTRVSEDTV